VRIIRQTWASLVEACKILFINPDRLPFGERMRAVAKVLAAGASVVVGTIVQEALQKTPIGAIPVVGDIISTFCGTAVTGIMSCSLLYFLDHSELIQKLVHSLDKMHFLDAEVEYYRQFAVYFERYAAELEGIDLAKFQKEARTYHTLVLRLESAQDENSLNLALRNALDAIGVRVPWGEGDFDAFMRDRSRTLVFA